MTETKSPDTDRTTVTTYVPAYQKSRWKTHANELEMSLSEFVRSMVQAGRRGFGKQPENDSGEKTPQETSSNPSTVEEGSSDGTTPRVDLREIILDTIETHGPLTWDELIDIVTDEFEDDIESELAELESNDRIERSIRTNEISLTGDHS